MTYYLGIDGGGSKTLAVVSDGTGRILGRGMSGCGNHQLGVELADRNMREAAETALAAAGLKRDDIAYAMFGLAGADREADFQILRPMVAAMGYAKHDIVCDTVIGLRAGTRQSDGVVLICGSGTNCYGMNAAGEELQVGGFGYEFGDFGGGVELAKEAFRAVIRAWEGREKPTALTELVLDAAGYDNVSDMFHGFLDEGKRAPHTFAKLLFQVADRDVMARSILERQGMELGRAASAVIHKLNMEADTFEVVLAGSILTRGDGQYVVPFIERQVKEAAPNCRLRTLGLEPAAGALLLAMDRDGMAVETKVYENLERDLSVKERNVEWVMD
ncbi:ATPase [Paenibacillus sp. 1011MAR3C5]|uniref:N-acetylglucosamine kinase n=1 Tax=Paenibacillus sp. 1011MAR3C5 TaxID=1675787 RepID=UPI000E6C9494|nr:BadF/BadG/BcrA/BcrD ATPase family protein [Paenibacillus sp. 1011MAR3C5]RJE84373.1 ATPase [Paenibacillus sp. 1011MAR3C5]